MKNPTVKIYCVHEELNRNIPCDTIDEDELKSGYWFKCPVCSREIGLMLETEVKKE